MMGVDIYRPDQWHDFFVMVGGAAAALTGLVFVAMSLNLGVIAQDATHRYRAISTLAGFTATFLICALVLMGGQNHLAVGIEWLVVSIIAAVMYVYGYIEAIKSGRSSVGLRPNRLVGGTTCYIAEMIGAILLLLGHLVGLYVTAVAMTILLAFMISGAWLLIVGLLGNGFLTGTVNKETTFGKGDIRSVLTRFTAENMNANQVLLELIGTLAGSCPILVKR